MIMRVNKIVTHLQPGDAYMLVEFLDQLREVLMQTYGDDITTMLKEAMQHNSPVDGAEDDHGFSFCGSFRTPSLRNVATRASFMHDGAFTSLRDVVAFYATRDSDPKRWYAGKRFDALPARYEKNVNVASAPYGQGDGPPSLNDHEIDAIVAFLGTLTDAAYR